MFPPAPLSTDGYRLGCIAEPVWLLWSAWSDLAGVTSVWGRNRRILPQMNPAWDNTIACSEWVLCKWNCLQLTSYFHSMGFEMGKSSFFWDCLCSRDNFYQISFGTFTKLCLKTLCENSIGTVKYLLLKNNAVFRKREKTWSLKHLCQFG